MVDTADDNRLVVVSLFLLTKTLTRIPDTIIVASGITKVHKSDATQYIFAL